MDWSMARRVRALVVSQARSDRSSPCSSPSSASSRVPAVWKPLAFSARIWPSQLPASLLSKSQGDEILDSVLSVIPLLIFVPFVLYVIFNAIKGALGNKSFGKGNFDR